MKDIKKFHDKPFDDDTLTKLHIFENYTKEWLPTIVMSQNKEFENLYIMDFFAGPGLDLSGVKGSPLRILEQVNGQINNIFQKKKKVHIVFNEKDSSKYESLKTNCEQYISKNNDLQRAINYNFVEISYKNCDIAEIFKEYVNLIKTNIPVLVFMDQYGVKYLSKEYLDVLFNSHSTDFLYFSSSSFARRFCETNAFRQTFVNANISEFQNCCNSDIHRVLIEQLRKQIPSNSKVKLYPFTIKKGANIYGIIFGASHPRAFDKFLKTAWEENGLNGEANFDIDNDLTKQATLFEERPLKKIEKFAIQIEEQIIKGKFKTNKDVFDYTLEEGQYYKYANEVVKNLKKRNIINYAEKSPQINYEKVYTRNKKIINFVVLK